MTPDALWQRYVAENPQFAHHPYQAWPYGSNEPDALLELTLRSVKTATASAVPVYEHSGEAIPKAGDFSVLLSSGGEARCIIRTTRVTVAPFAQVSEKQAFLEGEGDRSLAYWREAHRRFFTAEMESIRSVFTETMPVVCEEFVVVYRA